MIKFIFCMLLMASFPLYSFGSFDEKQFPEQDQVYVPGKDVGFSKYLAKSLWGRKKVVLTFDDGPDVNLTPKLLDTLKKYNVKATFFLLTERFNESTLPIVKRMIQEGHNIASHHHDHINNDLKSESEYRLGLKKSILETSKLIESENSPNREIYYRFPYGAYGSKTRSYHHLNVMKEVSSELFGDNCINFAFWDIDTIDWVSDMTSQDIAQNVMANLLGGTGFNFKKSASGVYQKVQTKISKPLGGGVILMHDVHKKTIDSVAIILENFQKKGIEVLEMPEVEEYSYKGKSCQLIKNNNFSYL